MVEYNFATLNRQTTRQLAFAMAPELLHERLGKGLYTPVEALKQLVSNSLDAGCSEVDIYVEITELGGAIRATISDDGRGMTPDELENAFRVIGTHLTPRDTGREIIGSKGIGRFSIYALAHHSEWTTTARVDDKFMQLRWEMSAERTLSTNVEITEVNGPATGTRVRLDLDNSLEVQRLFTSIPSIRRALFNAFAAYLAKYGTSVTISVNKQPVTLAEYVEESFTEQIQEYGEVPAAELHHLLLGHNASVGDSPIALVFSASGATIRSQPLDQEALPNRKYLGLVDSSYLNELAATNKADLAWMDPRFQALLGEATQRAERYLEAKRDTNRQSFIAQARQEPFYPYPRHPSTIAQRVEQTLYDNVLVALEANAKISTAPARQKQLIFALAQRLLLNEEDLATVLIEVLGLKGQEVERFAELIRQTSLSSIIAVSGLLVDRLRFLDELEELIYGLLMNHVKERTQLQKIIEAHTWLFGEQYHLMGADQSVATIMKNIAEATETSLDTDEVIDVHESARLIPDLYLWRTKKIEGPDYFQHLIVEMKAPKVRITPKHVAKLKTYAETVVQHHRFAQEPDKHKFQFIVVSSEISEQVKRREYQKDQPLGFLGSPQLAHPTDLWALQWSDFLDQRRSELNFLRTGFEMSADPETLSYLREHFPEFMPDESGAS